MISDPRISEYIRSLENSSHGLLTDIYDEAVKNNIPVIRRETASLLKTLVTAKRPENILEVGTAVGYSALLMAGAMPDDCHITTIEKYEPRIQEANKNIELAKETKRITLLAGDAYEILEKLDGKYDFVFMDAAKGQYITWLSLLEKLMPKGGILISDNIFQDGDIIESRFAVERRNRTIHSRMREYLYELKHSKQWETSIIPIGDGVSLSVRL